MSLFDPPTGARPDAPAPADDRSPPRRCGPTRVPEPTTRCRVCELNQRIQRALTRALPGEVWVRGEIRGLRPNRSGHLYFELVDPVDELDDLDELDETDQGVEAGVGRDRVAAPTASVSTPQPRRRDQGRGDQGAGEAGARVSAVLWGGTHRRLLGGRLRRAPGFEFRDDVAVRVRGRLEYRPQGGRLQLVISDVDPEYTLGTLSATRDRVVAALSADGLLDRNAQRPVPLVPLRVGLVTSHESAAFHDFVQELEGSGLGFHVTHVDARVQGVGSERALVRALRTLATRPVDVVAIVRGGGSRTDLVVFDSEPVARAIASMPVPVFTGIGHEIDTSVADLVAHTAFKTPTACAGNLVSLVAEFLGTLSERTDSLCRLARRHVDVAANGLDDRAGRVVVSGARALRGGEQHLDQDGVRLRRSALRAHGQARHQIDRAASRCRTASEVHLARADGRILRASDRIRPDRIRQILDLEHHRIETLRARADALDPVRVLARGYSLTRTLDGRLIRDPSVAPIGTAISTTLAAGRVHSIVTGPSADAAPASPPRTTHPNLAGGPADVD